MGSHHHSFGAKLLSKAGVSSDRLRDLSGVVLCYRVQLPSPLAQHIKFGVNFGRQKRHNDKDISRISRYVPSCPGTLMLFRP